MHNTEIINLRKLASNLIPEMYKITTTKEHIIVEKTNQFIGIIENPESLSVYLIGKTSDNHCISAVFTFSNQVDQYISIYDEMIIIENKIQINNNQKMPKYIIKYKGDIQELSRKILHLNEFTKKEFNEIIESNKDKFDIFKLK